MSPRVKRWSTWVGYPILYLLLLGVFARCSFPYQRLAERVASEFNQKQGPAGMRLEIAKMEGYFLSGVAAEGIRLSSAEKPAPAVAADAEEPKPSRPTVIDAAHGSVSLLGLLVGTTKVSFGAELGQGTVEGTFSSSSDEQSLDVTMEGIGVAGLPLLEDMVGLPMKGTLGGVITALLPERQMSKAEGRIALGITGVSAGDGKARILNTIALPELKVGEVKLVASIAAGRVKIDSISAKGTDFEMMGEGSIRLREPLSSSTLDLGLQFRFTDAYKNKSDITRGLFGDPNSPVPAIFEMNDKVRRSKRDDGFYGWRVMGTLNHPLFEPSTAAIGGVRSTANPARGAARKAK